MQGGLVAGHVIIQREDLFTSAILSAAPANLEANWFVVSVNKNICMYTLVCICTVHCTYMYVIDYIAYNQSCSIHSTLCTNVF